MSLITFTNCLIIKHVCHAVVYYITKESDFNVYHVLFKCVFLYFGAQEQAVDREHERDVFQHEIQKLEDQLKNSQKPQTGSEQRNREVTRESQTARETLIISECNTVVIR